MILSGVGLATVRPAGVLGRCLLAATLALVVSNHALAVPVQEATTEASPVAERLALLVGVNQYRSATIPSLSGALNDVQNMRRLLVETFGFPDDDDHIRVLTDESATRENILHSIEEHLIAKADRDSIVVFHYSGHGSSRADASGDETDGLDETLVPHDSGRAPDENRDILDDELNQLLATLTAKTPNVTFILDSCHSGSATRGSGKARTVAPDLRPVAGDGRPESARIRSASDGRSDVRPANSAYALLSGAAAGELAREITVGGRTYGTLTWHLANEIRRAAVSKTDVTYRDVMDTVKAKVTARYPSQHPQLEGPGAEQFVFSGRSQKATPHALASLAAGGRVALAVGQVHGVTEGSVYSVYAPGTKDFGPGTPVLAKVEVERVEVTESRAVILEGRLNDPSLTYRAVEREHRFPVSAVRVHLRGLSGSQTLGRIKAGLTDFGHIVVVDEATGYDLLLAEVEGSIITEGGEPSEISPRVPVDDPDVVARVVGHVAHWAKWLNLLDLVGSNVGKGAETSDEPGQELTVELEVRLQAGSGSARGTALMERDIDLTLVDGQRFEIEVRNTSSRKLYAALLDLSSDGSVSLVYPETTSEEFIAPGQSWSIELEAFLPQGREVVRDVLKLFATSTPCDFRFLQQSPVGADATERSRGRRRNPLEELLAGAALGTSRGDRSTPIEAWGTIERVLEIRSSRPPTVGADG